jgi:uncharacterized protein
MRLRKTDIAAIREVTTSVFGINSSVFLFGSRTDDSKRGGDIDLLIQCVQPVPLSELIKLKIKFLGELKKKIEDQKIDVLIDTGESKDPVIQTALHEGILL